MLVSHKKNGLDRPGITEKLCYVINLINLFTYFPNCHPWWKQPFRARNTLKMAKRKIYRKWQGKSEGEHAYARPLGDGRRVGVWASGILTHWWNTTQGLLYTGSAVFHRSAINSFSILLWKAYLCQIHLIWHNQLSRKWNLPI